MCFEAVDVVFVFLQFLQVQFDEVCKYGRQVIRNDDPKGFVGWKLQKKGRKENF